MILNGTKTEIIRGGDFSESAFSIKASGQAFKILSDGLYSNKKRAIMRELCCNAYDSHVAAGVADKPFKVIFPEFGESNISIQDFGTGLDDFECRGGWKNAVTGDKITHEQAEELVDSWKDGGQSGEHPLDKFVKFGGVFNTYFESTKSNSNDFIGALGLGSKSPFSYTDNYVVTAVKNGAKNAYSCFLSEDGIPSMALLVNEKTTAPNGVTITFPVAFKDINDFKSEAAIVLQWFTVKPEVENAKLQYPEHKVLMTGDGWKLLESDYYSRYPVAIQGKIEYKLDCGSFSPEIPKDAAYITDSRFVIDFNIGDLEISASRESLGYKPATVKAIVDRFTKINDEVRSQLAKFADGCATLFEAKKKIGKLVAQHTPISRLIASTGVPYDGTFIKSGYCTFPVMAGHFALISHRYGPGSGSNVRSSRLKIQDSSCDAANEILFVKNDSKYAVQRVKQYVAANNCMAYLFDKEIDGVEIDIDKIMRHLGDATYVLSSSLPYTPPKRGANTVQRSTVKLIKNGSRLTATEFEFEDGGVYFSTYRGDLTYDGKTVNCGANLLGRIFKVNKTHNWVDELYEATAPVAPKFAKSEDWEHLIDVVRRKLKTLIDADPGFGDKIHQHKTANEYSGSVPACVRFLFNDYAYTKVKTQVCDELGADHELVKIAESFTSWKNDGTSNDLHNLIIDYFPDLVPPAKTTRARLGSQVVEKYPMLGHVSDWTFSKEAITHITNYIKLVDKEQK